MLDIRNAVLPGIPPPLEPVALPAARGPNGEEGAIRLRLVVAYPRGPTAEPEQAHDVEARQVVLVVRQELGGDGPRLRNAAWAPAPPPERADGLLHRERGLV